MAFKTVFSNSKSLKSAVSACVKELSQAHSQPSSTFSFFVSPYYPKEDLLNAHHMLLDQLQKTVGKCTLFGAVVQGCGPNLSDGITLSQWNANDTFRLDLPSRKISVGKWQNLEFGNESEQFGKSSFSSEFESISKPPKHNSIPQLEALKSKSGNPGFMFFVSNKGQDCAITTLESSFPDLSISGIIGSNTPFVTGLDTTLYYNEDILTDSTVGVKYNYSVKQGLSVINVKMQVLCPSQKSKTTISHDQLDYISDPLIITSCQGNIILSLDGNPATKSLLSIVEKNKMVKNKDETPLYIQIYNETTNNAPVFRITSGDLSSGNLSIDTLSDLTNGLKIRFMKQLEFFEIPISSISNSMDNSINLFASDMDYIPPVTTSNLEPFMCSMSLISENGFYYKNPQSTGSVLNSCLVKSPSIHLHSKFD